MSQNYRYLFKLQSFYSDYVLWFYYRCNVYYRFNYRFNLCVTTLTPKVMVSGDNAFGWYLGLDGIMFLEPPR